MAPHSERRSTFLRAVTLAFLGLAGCAAPEPAIAPGSRISDLVPRALLEKANRNRQILNPDGFFRFPPSVRRVWIDVGAHHLETTRSELAYPDVAVIAIEPLAEAWGTWPASDRVIGLPVAIYLDRGEMDLHVNELDDTSSLLESAEVSARGSVTRTVEVRKVPVIRLEDVIAAIPARYALAYIKTDVQGVDLQVLQSAGPALSRAERVRAEVINTPEYKKLHGQGMASEGEIVSYLEGRGFRLDAEHAVQLDRAWLDQLFLNTRRSWFDRAWHDFRFGVPAT